MADLILTLSRLKTKANSAGVSSSATTTTPSLCPRKDKINNYCTNAIIANASSYSSNQLVKDADITISTTYTYSTEYQVLAIALASGTSTSYYIPASGGSYQASQEFKWRSRTVTKSSSGTTTYGSWSAYTTVTGTSSNTITANSLGTTIKSATKLGTAQPQYTIGNTTAYGTTISVYQQANSFITYRAELKQNPEWNDISASGSSVNSVNVYPIMKINAEYTSGLYTIEEEDQNGFRSNYGNWIFTGSILNNSGFAIDTDLGVCTCNSSGTTVTSRHTVGTISGKFQFNSDYGGNLYDMFDNVTIYQAANTSSYKVAFTQSPIWNDITAAGNNGTLYQEPIVKIYKAYSSGTKTDIVTEITLNNCSDYGNFIFSSIGGTSYNLTANQSTGTYACNSRGSTYSSSRRQVGLARCSFHANSTYGNISVTSSIRIYQKANVFISGSAVGNYEIYAYGSTKNLISTSAGEISLNTSSGNGYITSATLTFSSGVTITINSSQLSTYFTGYQSPKFSWSCSGEGASYLTYDTQNNTIKMNSRGTTIGTTSRTGTFTRYTLVTLVLTDTYNDGITQLNYINSDSCSITQAANYVTNIVGFVTAPTLIVTSSTSTSATVSSVAYNTSTAYYTNTSAQSQATLYVEFSSGATDDIQNYLQSTTISYNFKEDNNYASFYKESACTTAISGNTTYQNIYFKLSNNSSQTQRTINITRTYNYSVKINSKYTNNSTVEKTFSSNSSYSFTQNYSVTPTYSYSATFTVAPIWSTVSAAGGTSTISNYSSVKVNLIRTTNSTGATTTLASFGLDSTTYGTFSYHYDNNTSTTKNCIISSAGTTYRDTVQVVEHGYIIFTASSTYNSCKASTSADIKQAVNIYSSVEVNISGDINFSSGVKTLNDLQPTLQTLSTKSTTPTISSVIATYSSGLSAEIGNSSNLSKVLSSYSFTYSWSTSDTTNSSISNSSAEAPTLNIAEASSIIRPALSISFIRNIICSFTVTKNNQTYTTKYSQEPLIANILENKIETEVYQNPDCTTTYSTISYKGTSDTLFPNKFATISVIRTYTSGTSFRAIPKAISYSFKLNPLSLTDSTGTTYSAPSLKTALATSTFNTDGGIVCPSTELTTKHQVGLVACTATFENQSTYVKGIEIYQEGNTDKTFLDIDNTAASYVKVTIVADNTLYYNANELTYALFSTSYSPSLSTNYTECFYFDEENSFGYKLDSNLTVNKVEGGTTKINSGFYYLRYKLRDGSWSDAYEIEYGKSCTIYLT